MHLLQKYDPPIPQEEKYPSSFVLAEQEVERLKKNECRKRSLAEIANPVSGIMRDPLLDDMTPGECLYVHTLYKKYSATTQDKLVNALKFNPKKKGTIFGGSVFLGVVLYLVIGTILTPKGIDRWILFFLLVFAGALILGRTYFQI